jgi:hypothetical protein
MYQCEETETQKTGAMKLDEYLLALIKINTNIHIVEMLEYKLSLTLNTPYKKKYIAPIPIDCRLSSTLTTAECHQNIIGWNYFLKGFISTF